MEIVVFESEEWEAEACRTLQRRHQLSCTREPLTLLGASAFANAEVISIFVNSRLTAEVLSRFPRLRLVATRSTGYDHIDLTHCKAAGISVVNVPSYGDVTVAEHVFALLLTLTRNIPRSLELMREGQYDQGALRGTDLHGKTLGVIGTGRIGRRVIRIAQGFEMRVIAHDQTPDEAFAKAHSVLYLDLECLLRDADVISLHVPATAATAGLIGETEFSLMKPGAILINTARGNIVDVAALVHALSTGRIRAAGLDVLPNEPLMRDEAEVFRSDNVNKTDLRQMLANHVLMTMQNVVVTPHVAYNTIEARRRIIETTIANIEAFTIGKPVNLVQ